MSNYYVGFDIGGTFIKGGIIDQDGNVISKAMIPTLVKYGKQVIIYDIVNLYHQLVKTANLSYENIVGIGIGVPGAVTDDQRIKDATNLGWEDEDIVTEISSLTGKHVVVENDANAAVMGETRFGAAKGCKNVIMLTLGTGLGSGMIFNGQLYRGNDGYGAELGHTVLIKDGLQCGCGQKGCAEMYLSATALVKKTLQNLPNYPLSEINRYVNFKRKLNAKIIFSLYEIDRFATTMVNEFLELLSEFCLNIANGLRPEVIVIGGGVSKAGNIISAYVGDTIKGRIFGGEKTPSVKIVNAKFLNDAGFIGAASLLID